MPMTRNWGSIAFSVALVALFLFFLWEVRESLPPFILAGLIAMVMNPTLHRLDRAGWPRQRSVPLIFALFLLAGIAVLIWAIPLLLDQITSIINNFSSYVSQSQKYVEHIMSLPAIRRIPPSMRDSFNEQLSHAASYIPRSLSSVTNVFLATVTSIIWLFITLLATFYLMLDLPRISVALLRTIPLRHREMTRELGAQVAGVFSAYLRGMIIVCGLHGFIIAIALLIFRVPNAFALGFMSGILYMAPYIGPVLITLVTGLITLITFDVSKAIVVVVVVFLIGQIFDYIVTPRVLGGQVGLHPLVSLFAMVTAGTLFGIPGVLLAVPVAGSIAVALRILYPKIAIFQAEPHEEAHRAGAS
jgi:predicted PurR-regulated permease PerM